MLPHAFSALEYGRVRSYRFAAAIGPRRTSAGHLRLRSHARAAACLISLPTAAEMIYLSRDDISGDYGHRERDMPPRQR